MVKISKEFSKWDLVPILLIATVMGAISIKPLFISGDIWLGLFWAFLSLFTMWLCLRIYRHRGQVYIEGDVIRVKLGSDSKVVPINEINDIREVSSSGPLMVIEFKESSSLKSREFKFRPQTEGFFGKNMPELNSLIKRVKNR